MSLDSIQQNYADATGYLVDRSVSPPRVLGQAFLVSKSRAVTCASCVFNYTEAPWALAIDFIHPDVAWGIKSVTLHNDFDKVAARKWYLAQTGVPGDCLSLANDMASLVVDVQLPDMPTDKIGELHRALTIPFSSEGVEASGNIHGAEFLSVLQGIVQSGREGLLTLLDSRNIPIGRIQVGNGQIQKVYYRGLLGELAFFELYLRKPAEGFSFEPQPTFNWGNVRDIVAPAEALVQEAERRVNELPGMLTYLGGADARYQRRVENFAAQDASENIQWMIERLWASIDGYMTLDKMSERVGADTYSVVQAMRELVNRAAISMINRASPFHASGMVGAPLISHTDFEINAWDPLQAFYLDPISGCPVWLQGNFFGVANALQPKNMLHTIAMPVNVPGALILKDYKLIGIHSSPHVPKAGQPLPPVKLGQMMWMGALLEMSTKKIRPADDPLSTSEQSLAGLRSKLDEVEEGSAQAQPEKLEKFICPSCYSTNTKVGPCFNCGTVIEAPEPEAEPEGIAKMAAVQKVKQLQTKYKLTNQQMTMIAAVVIAVPLCLMIAMVNLAPHKTSQPTTTTTTTKAPEHPSSEKATKVATELAGFKGTAIPGYWYEDTGDLTEPAQSFALCSEQSNQKVVFIVFDDMSPVNNLTNFVGLPPFIPEVVRADRIKEIKLEENFQLLGDGNLHWFLGRYSRPEKKNPKNTEVILVGAYPSPVKGKSILVEGRSYKPGTTYDYKTTLWLCDQMAADYTARGNRERLGETEKNMVVDNNTGGDDETKSSESAEKPFATDEDIEVYCKKIEEKLQEKLKLPDDLQETLSKKKDAKIKAGLKVGIDEEGHVTKLEIVEGAGNQSATDALQKDVNGLAPYEEVPHTKAGGISIVVKLHNDKIQVESE